MPNMTPRQFARHLRQVSGRLDRAVSQELARAVQDAKKEAQALSSGTLTPADLRRMGHPYAVRAPATPLLPFVINAVSGEFRASWKVGPVLKASGTWTARLTNDSRVAAYLAGKDRSRSTMIRRPIDTEIVARVTPRLQKGLESAVAKAVQP